MYSIQLLAALGAIVGLLIALRGEGKKLGTAAFGLGIGTVIGCVVGLLLALAVIAPLTPRVETVYGPAKLVSMRSADGISGTFIWGSGSIGNSVSYNFMTVANDGSMVPNSVSASTLVHITEDANLKNTGTWTTTMLESDRNSPLFKWGIGHRDYTRTLRHDFRVPVGTVVQQFNIK